MALVHNLADPIIYLGVVPGAARLLSMDHTGGSRSSVNFQAKCDIVSSDNDSGNLFIYEISDGKRF